MKLIVSCVAGALAILVALTHASAQTLTELSSASDPIYTGAPRTTFDDVMPANPLDFPIILGSGADAVIVTVRAPNGSPSLHDCSNIDPQPVLAVSPASAAMTPGGYLQLRMDAEYPDGTRGEHLDALFWSSSDNNVATVTGDGLVNAVGPGTAMIQGSTTWGRSSFFTSATITVSAATLQSITVGAGATRLLAGTSTPLVVTGSYDDGSTRDVTSAAMWSSSATQFVDFDMRSLLDVRARAVAAGSANITATVAGLSDSVTIEATSAALVSLALSPPAPAVIAPERISLRAIGTYSDASTFDVSELAVWSTTNPAALAVTARPGLYAAAGAGASVAQAEFGGLTATTMVTVQPTPRTCEILSWGYSNPPNLVELTFDRPVRAFGIDKGECVAATLTVSIDGGADVVLPRGRPPYNCDAPEPRFVGASVDTSITKIVLQDGQYFAEWDNLIVVPGSGNPTNADIAVSIAQGTPIGRSEQASETITAQNLSAIVDAEAVRVVHLLPSGAIFTSASPSGGMLRSGVAPQYEWEVSNGATDSLLGGSSVALTTNYTTPPAPFFGCQGSIANIAVIRANTTDNDRTNNVDIALRPIDPASIPATEDCTNGTDDDCDNIVDCGDSDCFMNCFAALPAIAQGLSPSSPGLPPLPPLPGMGGPTSPPSPPLPNPRDFYPMRMDRPCTGFTIHGNPVTLPAYCCDVPPPADAFNPSRGEWNLTCRSMDPNFLESIPEPNALGVATATAGAELRFIVHYENIGGVDARDVQILSVLPPDLDASTLVVEDGGVFDPQTRMISWIDPLVFPMDERQVHYRVEMRADAPPLTRARSVATIIFPDAFPPSRIDTNAIEHVVPDPSAPRVPVLDVFKCERMSGDAWLPSIENRGFGFAREVSAKIAGAPASVSVSDDSCAFAQPDDPDPTRAGTVLPLTRTVAIDPVRFTSASGADPCEALTWEITFKDARGVPSTVRVQAAPDVNEDGVPDYLQSPPSGSDAGVGPGPNPMMMSSTDSGCSCRATPSNSSSALVIMLCLLGWLVRIRGRGASLASEEGPAYAPWAHEPSRRKCCDSGRRQSHHRRDDLL